MDLSFSFGKEGVNNFLATLLGEDSRGTIWPYNEGYRGSPGSHANQNFTMCREDQWSGGQRRVAAETELHGRSEPAQIEFLSWEKTRTETLISTT